MTSVARFPLPRLAEAWLLLLAPAAAAGPLAGVGSVFAYRLLLVAGIVACAVVVLLRRPARHPLALAAGGLSALTLLSSGITWLWPGWPADGLIELLSLVAALVCAAAALTLVPAARRLLVVARGVVLTLLAEAGVVAWEYFSGLHLPTFALVWDDDRFMGVWFMMAGTFANPNELAHLCVVAGPVAAWAALADKSKPWRFAALAATAAVPPMVWLSQSRTGLLVLAIELLVAALLWRWGRILVAVAAAGALATALAAPGLVAATGLFADKDPLGSDNPRANLALNGLHMLRETWGLGVGPGGYARWSATADLPHETFQLVNPHNAVVEVLVAYGVLPGLAFATLLGAVFLWAVRSAALHWASAQGRWLGAGAAAVVALWPLIGLANSHWMPLSWSMFEVTLLFVVADEVRRRARRATTLTA